MQIQEHKQSNKNNWMHKRTNSYKRRQMGEVFSEARPIKDVSMPKLTEEKKDSIWDTYHKTKDHVKTAKIEEIDPRTSRKVVSQRKSELHAQERANSKGEKSRDVSRVELANRELELQLEASRRFERGDSNVRVCQDLKLHPQVVIKFRNDYNQMLEADLGEELERKRHEKTMLNKIIEECKSKLEQVHIEIESETDLLTNSRSQRNDLTEEVERLESSVHKLKVSESDWKSKEQEARRSCLAVEVKNQETLKKRDKEIVDLAIQVTETRRRLAQTEPELKRQKQLNARLQSKVNGYILLTDTLQKNIENPGNSKSISIFGRPVVAQYGYQT